MLLVGAKGCARNIGGYRLLINRKANHEFLILGHIVVWQIHANFCRPEIFGSRLHFCNYFGKGMLMGFGLPRLLTESLDHQDPHS